MTEEEAIEKAYDLCIGCMLEKYCHEAALHCDLFWMRVEELEGEELRIVEVMIKHAPTVIEAEESK